MTIRKPGSHDADQWNSSLAQDGRFDDLHRPYGFSGIGDANGAGVTELIAQDYNKKLGRWEFSGRQDTDATLIGSRYTITDITYSFPTSGKFYAKQGYPAGSEPAGQIPFNPQQQDAVRYALHLVEGYCNLTFTEIDETKNTHANLRYSQTTYSQVGSAYANFPSSSEQAGDVWFGRTNQPYYLTPQPGNWGQATVMHETGHTLGLKHGHQDYTNVDLTGYIDGNPNGDPRYGSVALTHDHDGQDWSLMTYRSDPSNSIRFEGDGANQPQTYMMDDIAALQYLYGANFNSQGGDTVYSWDPNTGIESINGVAQAVPTANKISMTLWDGNGTDTYDLSNYTTNLKIDLRPGEFSTFSQDQLVNHQAYSGGHALAVGNVANALLYQDDLRSLIENAEGGTGNDQITGNQGTNQLDGGAGDDSLSGGDGGDVLIGGAGTDTLAGGAGKDTFFFASGSGKDVIGDFAKGDIIRIDVNGVNGFSDLKLKSDGSGGTLVSWKGGSVDLTGVAKSMVKADAFAFGSLPAAHTVFASDGAGSHGPDAGGHFQWLPHVTSSHLALV